MTLLERTRSLLAASPLSLREIAEGAGDPVKYEWLKKFAGEYESDPAIGRVQRLHDFLAAQKGARKRKAA